MARRTAQKQHVQTAVLNMSNIGKGCQVEVDPSTRQGARAKQGVEIDFLDPFEKQRPDVIGCIIYVSGPIYTEFPDDKDASRGSPGRTRRIRMSGGPIVKGTRRTVQPRGMMSSIQCGMI